MYSILERQKKVRLFSNVCVCVELLSEENEIHITYHLHYFLMFFYSMWKQLNIFVFVEILYLEYLKNGFMYWDVFERELLSFCVIHNFANVKITLRKL